MKNNNNSVDNGKYCVSEPVESMQLKDYETPVILFCPFNIMDITNTSGENTGNPDDGEWD